MRTRVLIFPFDLMSHYLRCIQLAQQRYADCEVLFADSPAYGRFVKDAGYATFPVKAFDADKVLDCALRFDFSWLNETDIEQVFLSQARALRALKPGLVIGDTSPSLKMAAEITGTRYVSLMNGYMTAYYAGTRQVPRVHFAYDYLRRLPQNMANLVTRVAEAAAFRQVHLPFRRLRKRYGLRRINTYLKELEGDENLICDDPRLFPQGALPAAYKIIGPLYYQCNTSEDKLLETLDHSKPTLCVCLGSSGNWQALSFLSHTAYAGVNIIVAGDKARTLNAAHIYHKEFVNLDCVLPFCDLVICHGGNGTIYAALKYKVRLLCLTQHFEQEWNARRIAELKLGRWINDAPEQMVQQTLSTITDKQAPGRLIAMSSTGA